MRELFTWVSVDGSYFKLISAAEYWSTGEVVEKSKREQLTFLDWISFTYRGRRNSEIPSRRIPSWFNWRFPIPSWNIIMVISDVVTSSADFPDLIQKDYSFPNAYKFNTAVTELHYEEQCQTGRRRGSNAEWQQRSRTWHRGDNATDTQWCQGDRLLAVGGRLRRTRLMQQLWMWMLKRLMKMTKGSIRWSCRFALVDLVLMLTLF